MSVEQANKKSKEQQPKQTKQDEYNVFQWLEDILGTKVEQTSKQRSELEKLTKEQLIKELLRAQEQIKELNSKLEQNESIANAVKQGFALATINNIQSGVTIDRTGLNSLKYEVSHEIDDKIERANKNNAAAYNFIQELKKYKSEKYQEMYSENLVKFLHINPYDQDEEHLNKIIEVMHKEEEQQEIFNKGWDKAIEKTYNTIDELKIKSKLKRELKIEITQNKRRMFN